MKPESLTLTLPLPPPGLHPNRRTRNHNYEASLKRAARGNAAMVANAAIMQDRLTRPVFDRAVVQPVFFIPRKQDDDNLRAWLKPYLDGLQDAGIVQNDSQIVVEVAQQNTGRTLDHRVELIIRKAAAE